MAIRQRGDSWQVDVKVGAKRIRKNCRTEEEAKQKEAELLGTHEEKRALTMTDLIEITWDHAWSQNKTGAAAVRLATSILKDMRWEHKEVVDMSAKDLAELRVYYRDTGNTGATLNRKLSNVNKMLSTAVELGYVDKVPHLKQMKEDGGRQRVLTGNEERLMIKMFKEHEYYKACALFVFLLDTGCRVSEALDIQECDVSRGTNPHVRVGNFKTKDGIKRYRNIPLTTRALEACLKWQGLQQRAFNKQWDNVALAIGITGKDREEFVPHMLRHTCATRLAEMDHDLRDIKEWLGHSTIEMTMRYAKFKPSRLLRLRDTLN